MFEKGFEGTLMELTDSLESRYNYTVWFDYTKKAINLLQEGTLLAAPNFAGNEKTKRYSILEVTRILPTHYALEGGSTGYPGFVVEAARSAAQDWESQENEPTEDTTKIRAIAIPTNLEIVEQVGNEANIGIESNIAMVGARVRVLNSEHTNLIYNRGISRESESNITVIGEMARDSDVRILLRIDELYRTHFAIFGFTGVGKSNLLSTIVSKVFVDTKDPLKLVFFDLMGEYTALLIDQLLDKKINGNVLSLGRFTLPEKLFSFINGKPDVDIEEATKQLEQYTLLPKALIPLKPGIRKALRSLLEGSKLKYFSDAQSMTVWDLFFTDKVPWGKDRRGAKSTHRLQIVKDVLRPILRGGDYKKTTFNPKIAKEVIAALNNVLVTSEFKEDFGPKLQQLGNLERDTGEVLKAAITLDDLIRDLNDTDKPSLWIIQAHNPDDLRRFSKTLGERIYEDRRQAGVIDPLVSFIFDEADEFIRREAQGTYLDSAEIAQTLARRGRKFGLGIGIATQRIRYLDTNIMSQPHTYFVSKLPRASDREAVAESFGISEDLLTQTFKFKKGQWLLMSHDATGIEAMPIPIKTPDANQRIINWLQQKL